MRSPVLVAALIILPLSQAGCTSSAGEEQTLVDRATLTVQEMVNQTVSEDPKIMLRRSKAVMVCPRVFKAGFFFGGEGGSCVLLARAGNGTWSYPAFYNIGSGSFGFQFGIQDSQLIIMIMTNKGLSAVMDSQVKLGGSASIAIATIGAGVQGSTTAAVGADIIGFSTARGLYGGVSLEGSVMSSKTESNQAYYGQPYAARQIVISMQGANGGADPLREILTRYGTGGAPSQVEPPIQPPPGYAPPYQPGYQPPATQQQQQGGPVQLAPQGGYPSRPPVGPPGGRGPIQEQNLAPPTR